MADVAVELIGGRELRRAFNEIGDAANDDLKGVNQRAAQIVLNRALPNIPVRSGKLKKSAKAIGTKASGRVQIGTKARTPYALPIHWGWPKRNIKPNRFLTNALDETKDQVREQYTREMNDLMRKFGLA